MAVESPGRAAPAAEQSEGNIHTGTPAVAETQPAEAIQSPKEGKERGGETEAASATSVRVDLGTHSAVGAMLEKQ